MIVTEGKPCSDRRSGLRVACDCLNAVSFCRLVGAALRLSDSSSKHFYQLLKIAVPEHELLEVAAEVLREMLSHVSRMTLGV